MKCYNWDRGPPRSQQILSIGTLPRRLSRQKAKDIWQWFYLRTYRENQTTGLGFYDLRPKVAGYGVACPQIRKPPLAGLIHFAKKSSKGGTEVYNSRKVGSCRRGSQAEFKTRDQCRKWSNTKGLSRFRLRWVKLWRLRVLGSTAIWPKHLELFPRYDSLCQYSYHNLAR